jgi:hypothetical protein
MKTHLATTESLTVVIDDKEITVTAQQLLGLKQAETPDNSVCKHIFYPAGENWGKTWEQCIKCDYKRVQNNS